MAKIKIEWTTEVTESHETEVDYEDFAEACKSAGQEPPTLEEIQAGHHDLDWGNLGAEFEGVAEYVSVDEREIESITVIES